MGKLVRIVVDAFGGDNAPDEVIKGSVEALRAFSDIHLLLTGDEGRMKALLQGCEYDTSRLTLVHAPSVITTHDDPVRSIRGKKDSSIVVGLNLVKSGEAEAFVSAGSTGAVLAGAQLILRTLPGIHKPALAPMVPTTDKPALLIDCGANVDCKPINLLQFAIMGSAYMQRIIGVENPRVGLINIGDEAEKGNALVKAVYPRLEQLPLNFVGNVEAREIPFGKADVLVADAFVGNVVLKFMEGMAKAIFDMLKVELTVKTVYKAGAALLKPAFRSFKHKMDYEQYGGAPLLGVNGCVYKTHGSSKALSIHKVIEQARGFVQGGVLPAMEKAISESGAVFDRFAE